jgi:predicted nucleotidyltransferase component of viral defense system
MDKQSLTYKTHLIANQTGLPFNAVLTHFFLEVLLSRIAGSTGSKNIIFKGGFLLASIFGIKTRTTVDIDLLVTGMEMTEISLRTLINQFLGQPIIPEVDCEVLSIQPIRQEDPYGGYRVRILCQLENIRQIVPLDIAVGDPITPGPIQYEYKTLFMDQAIQLSSYNIETILAEKLETVYRRGLVNSRCKDFYDIHVIWKLQANLLDREILKSAFENTCMHRFSQIDRRTFHDLLEMMMDDDQMAKRWRAYVKRNSYANDITFVDTLKTLIEIMPVLFE